MYITTINEKGGHTFERKQGGVYEKVWRKGGNDKIIYIIILKNK